ncbi:cell surface protein, partial [Candidatus Magnetomorum sp. HK-1]
QIVDGGITAVNLAAANGGSLTNGVSGKSLVSNADGTFSWQYSSPFVHSGSTGNVVYQSTIQHSPYFDLSSEDQYYISTVPDGNIVYSHGSSLVTFSSSGAFISSFGENGTGNYEFDSRMGVTFDSNGKMYVADAYNQRVMIYDSSKVFDFQLGTTYSSGTGNGEFNRPYDVAVNSAGKIYVADKDNHRIQIFSSTGTYETTIGTGSSSSNVGEFNEPNSIEIDNNDKIYVSDSLNNRIQVFSSSNAYEYSFTVDYQSASVNISQIALDSSGNIIVAFKNSDCGALVYSNSGSFLFSIGTDEVSISNENSSNRGGVTVDNDDNVFVVSDDEIYKFSNSGTYIFKISGNSTEAGALNGPAAVDIDSNGNIFVLEQSNKRISVFNSSEAFSYSIYYSGNSSDQGVLNYPADMVLSNDKVYVADTYNSRIQVFNSSSGAYEYSFSCSGSPNGIALDDSGKIYASITNSHVIEVYSSTGTLDYTIGGSGVLSYPYSLDFDSNGDIYIADSSNKRVSVFSSTGTFQYSITNNFGGPVDVALDSDDNIYILDQSTGTFSVFSNSRAFQYSMCTQGSSSENTDSNYLLYYPKGLTVDDNGTIYVADSGNNRLQIFAPASTSYYVNDSRVGIGTSTPGESLEVVGSVKIVDGNQGTGKVLVSDADGKASWQSISTDITDGSITDEKLNLTNITANTATLS